MKANDFIDVTDVTCPITFVKAQVALQDLKSGEILEVKLIGEKPLQNVPRSLKDNGHKILETRENKDGSFSLFVEKDGLNWENSKWEN